MDLSPDSSAIFIGFQDSTEIIYVRIKVSDFSIVTMKRINHADNLVINNLIFTDDYFIGIAGGWATNKGFYFKWDVSFGDVSTSLFEDPVVTIADITPTLIVTITDLTDDIATVPNTFLSTLLINQDIDIATGATVAAATTPTPTNEVSGAAFVRISSI